MTAIPNTATVPAGGKTSSAPLVTFVRPANVTAYSAGDVIGDEAAAVLEFPAAPSGRMTHVTVGTEESKTANLELYIFDSEPTNIIDNALLVLTVADLEKLVAAYTFTDASKKTVNATGQTIYMVSLDGEGTNPHCFTAPGKTLYGVLVTRSAFTPGSGVSYTVRIHIEAD